MTDHNASINIATSLRAPAGARRFLDDHRASWMDDSILYDAKLIVTEVVNNAIEHGGVGDSLDLTVRVSGYVFWVGVAQPRFFDRSRESGFGLTLIDVLSTRWGTLDWSNGTLVWFEMEGNNEAA